MDEMYNGGEDVSINSNDVEIDDTTCHTDNLTDDGAVIIDETIEWADEMYSCRENIEKAFVYIELRGNRLVRRFVYIQEKQEFCIESPEVVDINSLEDEVLQSEQFKELKKTGHIIIKKY